MTLIKAPIKANRYLVDRIKDIIDKILCLKMI